MAKNTKVSKSKPMELKILITETICSFPICHYKNNDHDMVFRENIDVINVI